MEGPKPNPETHSEDTGRDLEYQTDKGKWKIVPCNYAGCNCDLVVNVFYAPHKAKCSMHGDRTNKAVVASHLTFATSDAEVKPNGSLANMLCPICQNPLVVIAVEEMGWITFGCTDGFGLDWKTCRARVAEGTKFCGTSVTVRPNWSAMEFKKHPSELVDFLEEVNVNQKCKYFDKVGY